MKFPLLLTAVCLSGSLGAETIYVNNNEAFPADYRTFDEAYAAASADDTIILAGSETSYGTISIVDKPIKLVGNGFNDEGAPNVAVRADSLRTEIGRLSIGADASGSPEASEVHKANGSQVIGVEMNSCIIYSSQCQIDRCDLRSASTVYGSLTSFTRCETNSVFLTETTLTRPFPDDPLRVIASGALFQNCEFRGAASPQTSANTSATVEQCVINIDGSQQVGFFTGSYTTGSAVFRNCIVGNYHDATLLTGALNSNNFERARFHHCLIVAPTAGSANVIPAHSADNGNVRVSADVAEIFANDTLALADASPAKGIGENGGDVGVFGGDTPFVNGGIPGIPLINKLNILSSNPTTGLTFAVEAEARE